MNLLRLLVLVLLLGQEKLEPTPEDFAQRRDALRKHFPDAVLILDARPLHWEAPPQFFDFKYLTGFQDDAGILVLGPTTTTLFHSDSRKAPAEFKDALTVDQFDGWMKRTFGKTETIHVRLRPEYGARLKEALPQVKDTAPKNGPLDQELRKMRMVKSDLEIKLMRKASDATNKAHLAAMKALKPGMNEKEIQKVIEDTFKKEGCSELAFPSICGSGKNGTVLHYMENTMEIPKDTLVVCDIGAALHNYCTDITRTLPTSGKFSEKQRLHYQCVLDAQKAAEDLLRPGTTLRTLDQAAQKVFADRELKKWSYAASADMSVRHGLGHFVGLSVHDSGGYDSKLEPGMVITIEPGWYDKDEGYGIRIEDIYLVTKDGFDRLSAGAPREIEEIEKAMSGR